MAQPQAALHALYIDKTFKGVALGKITPRGEMDVARCPVVYLPPSRGLHVSSTTCVPRINRLVVCDWRTANAQGANFLREGCRCCCGASGLVLRASLCGVRCEPAVKGTGTH